MAKPLRLKFAEVLYHLGNERKAIFPAEGTAFGRYAGGFRIHLHCQGIAELKAMEKPAGTIGPETNTLSLPQLMGLVRQDEAPHPNCFGLLMDYLELVDWSGRAIREDKRNFINHSTPRAQALYLKSSG